MTRQYVHITGFSRSGTTLLSNLFRCFANTFVAPGEKSRIQMDTALKYRSDTTVTKRPTDALHLDIMARLIDKRDTHVVYMIRDPRDWLTSINRYSRGDDPDIEPHYDPQHLVEKIVLLPQFINEVTIIRYEDLVRDPNTVQQRLMELFDLESECDFTEGYLRFPSENQIQEQKAMGTIRPIDTSGIGRWALPKYKNKITQIMGENIELSSFVNDYYTAPQLDNRIKKGEGRRIYDQKSPDAPWLISYPRCGRHWYTLLLERNLQIPITRYQTSDMPWGLPQKKAEDLRIWARHEINLEFKPNKYIYLNREDSVSVIFSALMMGLDELPPWRESSEQLYHLTERVRQESIRFKAHRDFFMSDTDLLISYEDLSSDPQTVMSRSADFFEETFDVNSFREVSPEEVNAVFGTEVSHVNRELYAEQKAEFDDMFGDMIRNITCDISTS